MICLLTSLSLDTHCALLTHTATESGLEVNEWVTIGIGLLALIFSIQQGYQNRKHNRLTVSPLIDLEIKFPRNTFSLVVYNKGMGPATNIKMNFKSKGNKTSFIEIADDLKNLAEKSIQVIQTGIDEQSLFQNTNTTILEIKKEESKGDIKEIISHLHRFISVEIVCQDLYGINYSFPFSMYNLIPRTLGVKGFEGVDDYYDYFDE